MSLIEVFVYRVKRIEFIVSGVGGHTFSVEELLQLNLEAERLLRFLQYNYRVCLKRVG